MPFVITKAKRKPSYIDAPAETPEQKAEFAIEVKTTPPMARAIGRIWKFLDASEMAKGATPSAMLEHVNWYNPASFESVNEWAPVLNQLANAYSSATEMRGQAEVRIHGFDGQVMFTVQKRKASVTIPANRDSWLWIATQSSDLVTKINVQQREMLRVILAEAFAMGTRPDDIAKEISKLVGLTDRYAKAVLNRKALMIENGASDEAAEIAAERYADQLGKSRARTIARTEIKDAQSEGQLGAWRMLRNEGMIPVEATKEWMAVEGSPRTSDICLELDGQIVPIDGLFYSGVLGQEIERAPAHPNCRSIVRLRLPEN
ncbi:MAG: hypothetical protein KAV87_67890 [Desulfobacteraceae bacterium]|nr:hypothetical protein [Desulfobacteraceae bacterium]